ncbi:MAG: M42 family metallopeptidase [Planctomycetota bacterium]
MSNRTAFLKELCEAFGPPGLEDDVAAILRRRTAEFCEVGRDNIGSFVATKKGTSKAPRIMVAGHMDEVGFMVTNVESSGYLRLRPLGGWWPHVLLGQRVMVRTRKGDFLGVIGSKPPHELKDEDRKKVLDFDDLFVDLGVAAEFDVAEATGVRRGDFVVPHAPFETLANEHLHVVKAWDNRVGCATVQEEVGLRGAATSAEKVRPDIAFAVDVGIARDTPGHSGAEKNEEKLGGGASVLLLEGSVVSHPRLVRFVLDVAEEEGILHHTATIQRGATDANRFQISGQGVPSLAICVPSRYIHSHSSIVDRRDYEAALKLLVAVVRRLDAKTVAGIRG